ncbi:MAG TPA: hypothetical protein VGD17_13465 [Chitinophagaceae bacterium]
MPVLSRKKFIRSLAGASGLLAVPLLLSGQQAGIQQGPKQDRPTKGPALDKELVRDFVGAAHKDFDKVKVMLQETPDLLNAVHNLGGWDWEDAIGAAGHVGLRDMAIYLLQQGARPTICVAAMLGELELVKAFVQAFPDMKNAVGPHKISLVRHAKAGGEKSAKVLDYLISIGAKE